MTLPPVPACQQQAAVDPPGRQCPSPHFVKIVMVIVFGRRARRPVGGMGSGARASGDKGGLKQSRLRRRRADGESP